MWPAGVRENLTVVSTKLLKIAAIPNLSPPHRTGEDRPPDSPGEPERHFSLEGMDPANAMRSQSEMALCSAKTPSGILREEIDRPGGAYGSLRAISFPTLGVHHLAASPNLVRIISSDSRLHLGGIALRITLRFWFSYRGFPTT